VAHGTFYVHFSGKDEVLEEVLQELNTAVALRIGEVWAAAASAGQSEQVRGAAGTFLDYWAERRGFAAAYAEKLAAGTRLAQLRDGVNPPMTVFISALLREADTDLPNVELATHALLGIWVRVLLQYLFSDRVERAEAVDTLVHMTLGAVRGVA
jgi:AcrR family transcriptional regulator